MPWLAAPELARLTGSPRQADRGRELTEDDRRLLRDVALRTWMFFERLLTSEDHWLPPDNYQEGRARAVARRTSPTNIGMALTAMISAWDLGYIGPLEFEALVLNTLESMRRLERHRGHLLNWYGTEDLRPLEPRYVSTVDSGNLAAALIALQQGLAEVIQTPVFRPALMEGLADTVRSAEQTLAAHGEPELRRLAGSLRRGFAELQAGRAQGTRSLVDCYEFLRDLEDRRLAEIDEIVGALADESGTRDRLGALRDLRVWTRKLHQQVGLLRRLCRTLHPWLAVLSEAPPALRDAAPGSRRQRGWFALASRLAEPVSLADLPQLAEWTRHRSGELLAEAAAELDESEGEAIRQWGDRLNEALEEARRRSATAHAEPGGSGPRGRATGGRDGLRLPVRPPPRPVPHRVQRVGRGAGSRITTICWRPRPGWPATWRSPGATSPSSTGCRSAGRTPGSVAGRCSSRGPPRCSSTCCRRCTCARRRRRCSAVRAATSCAGRSGSPDAAGSRGGFPSRVTTSSAATPATSTGRSAYRSSGCGVTPVSDS